MFNISISQLSKNKEHHYASWRLPISEYIIIFKLICFKIVMMELHFFRPHTQYVK